MKASSGLAWASLLILFLSGCQTTFSAKTAPEYPDAPLLTWPEIEQVMQEDPTRPENIQGAAAKQVERSALKLMADRKNWGRLEYLATRLERAQAHPAYILALKIRAHLAQRSQDFQGAEGYLTRLVELQPEDARLKLALGILYLQGGLFAKAIPYLNDQKDEPRARLGLISAHRLLGDNDRVDSLCSPYEESRTEDWEIVINCALFENQNMNSPDQALKLLRNNLATQAEEGEAGLRLRAMISEIEATRVVRADTAVEAG